MPIKTYELKRDEKGDIIWGSNYRGTRDFSNIGKMRLYLWENDMFILGKSRKSERSCMCCENKIKPSCYFYGDRRGYYRVCVKCYPNFINNFVGSMKEHIATAKDALKEYKEKEGMLIKNNLVCSV